MSGSQRLSVSARRMMANCNPVIQRAMSATPRGDRCALALYGQNAVAASLAEDTGSRRRALSIFDSSKAPLSCPADADPQLAKLKRPGVHLPSDCWVLPR